MEWPIQSPELNPIQNLCDHVQKSSSIANVTEIWNVVKKTWLNLPINNITNLINSMPRWCVAVIKLGEDQQNVNISFYIILRVIFCLLVTFYDVTKRQN